MTTKKRTIVSILDIRQAPNPKAWSHFASTYACGYWKKETTFDPDDMVGIKPEHAHMYGLAAS